MTHDGSKDDPCEARIILANIHKALFYALVFFLPVNLAKHFVFSGAYVNGLLSDYLVPAIYVTDILIVGMLLTWFINLIVSHNARELRLGRVPHILLLFLTAAGFSAITSANFPASVFFFLSFLLHLLFCFYVACTFSAARDFATVVKVLSVSVFLLSVLAIFQWGRQGSVFDNYLFFGEQPYSSATPGIAREGLFGRYVVPSYGTFRHPNAFGGFLSVVLLWILYAGNEAPRTRVRVIIFLLGVLALLLTFSQSAWGAFVFGAAVFEVIKRFGKRAVAAALIITFVISVSALFLPALQRTPALRESRSVLVRGALLSSAYENIPRNLFFGVGLNASTTIIDKHFDVVEVVRFTQPPHNIFVLLLLEGGAFFLLAFVFLLGYVFYLLLRQSFGVPALVFVSLLQIVVMGSFDHYFFTMQQTKLLFLLTLGIGLAYTKRR